MPRPDEATYDALVAHLETALDRAAAAHPNPGRTDTFRRLSRIEYQNAIRDILALDVDVIDAAAEGRCEPRVRQRERTASCRRRCSSATWRRRRRSAAPPSAARCRRRRSHVVVLPSDLTQEEHLDGLPFGTRGGTIVAHTFPLDGDYEIQIRLSRDRNENVEGLTEPQQIELTLDGSACSCSRSRRIAISRAPTTPTKRVDKHLKLRMQRHRRPARGRRHLPAQDLRARGNRASAEPGALQHGPASARRRSRSTRCRSPVRSSAGARERHAEPPPRLRRARPRERRRARKPLREADRLGARASRVPAGGDRRGPRGAAAGSTDEARARGRLRAGIEMALRAVLASTEFLFRIERDPKSAAPQTPYRISDVELASRLSFFLWSSVPDDELLDLAIAGTLSQPGDARAAGEADAGRSAGRGARHQLRGPVAVSAQPGGREPGRAAVPRLRRQPASGLPARDRAVLREHRAGRPQRAGPAARQLHVPERAPREALRHPERVRQPLPARLARRRTARAAACSATAAS